jgi:hypothetical protein
MAVIRIIKPINFKGLIVLEINKKGTRTGRTALNKFAKDFKKFGEKEELKIEFESKKGKIIKVV